MASPASLIAEENFHCSICLSVFSKPVSTPCGHNFCIDCITGYWDTSNPLITCPLCKEEFNIRPKLRVNHFIAEMAAKFVKSVQEKSANITEESGNGNVLCTLCTGARRPALQSCLVCMMSYCQIHLEPHQKLLALKKHKLIHPVENLESRICKYHGEPLDLFCSVDQMFLCDSCKDRDHKQHKIVTLEEEALMRKDQLESEKKDANKMIDERQQKIWEIERSLEANKNNAAKALSCSEHVMTAMVEYIKRGQAELADVIETKQRKKQAEADGLINELNGEIMQITQKSQQLDNISVTDDPFRFLESYLSLTIIPPQVKDWSDVTLSCDPFKMQEVMASLEATVTREIRMLCDPNFKEVRRHAVELTLDPDTANSYLYISEDGKQVTWGTQRRRVPKNPERFDCVHNVLAREGFASGRFYYEVQVKDKKQWDLGVAKQSINRRGDIRLSPKNGYWTIWLRKGNEFTANTDPPVNLHVTEVPEKIGVFVDYEDGQVSFYDVDTRASIFSFTGCNFTEKIFPFFSPCATNGAENSAPLIITPVRNNK